MVSDRSKSEQTQRRSIAAHMAAKCQQKFFIHKKTQASLRCKSCHLGGNMAVIINWESEAAHGSGKTRDGGHPADSFNAI
jgi:hypothetical protein